MRKGRKDEFIFPEISLKRAVTEKFGPFDH